LRPDPRRNGNAWGSHSEKQLPDGLIPHLAFSDHRVKAVASMSPKWDTDADPARRAHFRPKNVN
ncbi:MAG: hypothetical protein VYE64_11865, partial [Planctomycetota bacterium]|nr:hypothetical protein [Planctomycetota bacterium]